MAAGSGNHGGAHCPTAATPADIRHELHRLHESQMRLLLMAEELGLAVPRSCCRHRGASACANCSAEWLATTVRHMARSAKSR
jgi:hypothetical protein